MNCDLAVPWFGWKVVGSGVSEKIEFHPMAVMELMGPMVHCLHPTLGRVLVPAKSVCHCYFVAHADLGPGHGPHTSLDYERAEPLPPNGPIESLPPTVMSLLAGPHCPLPEEYRVLVLGVQAKEKLASSVISQEGSGVKVFLVSSHPWQMLTKWLEWFYSLGNVEHRKLKQEVAH